MRVSVCVFLIVCSCHLFSQTKAKPDVVKTIGNADTVVFTSRLSGCFNAHTNTYKFSKLKNGDRSVYYKKDTAFVTRVISAKKYTAFITEYKKSYMHFTEQDIKKTCTSVTTCELDSKTKSAKFVNGICKADYEPEIFLLSILK